MTTVKPKNCPHCGASLQKTKLTLLIDDEVIKTAKKHIPNISQFVEERLKQEIIKFDKQHG
jgi:post-segregation antitoxin (ccd killing protein)